MQRTTSKLAVFILSFIMFIFSSCGSRSLSSSEMTPELKIALINISSDFLNQVNAANFVKLQERILWVDYLKRKGRRYSKNSFQQDLRYLKRKTTKRNHPLINLDLLDMDLDDDYATISFQKFNKENAPVIRIIYFWTGRGWLIVDDSIFGPGNLIDNLRPKRKR